MTLQSHFWAYVWKKKNMVQNDTYTPLSIATLFIITETWKQTKCPLTEEGIEKT